MGLLKSYKESKDEDYERLVCLDAALVPRDCLDRRVLCVLLSELALPVTIVSYCVSNIDIISLRQKWTY